MASEGGECRGSVSARVPGKRRRPRCVPEKEEVRVKKRERESFSASRENDSRRTNEKGSTMTAKRAHPPRRFDLSVLESLKRGTRVSFGRDVRITSVYIRIYIRSNFRLQSGTFRRFDASRWRIDPLSRIEREHIEDAMTDALGLGSLIVEPSRGSGIDIGLAHIGAHVGIHACSHLVLIARQSVAYDLCRRSHDRNNRCHAENSLFSPATCVTMNPT